MNKRDKKQALKLYKFFKRKIKNGEHSKEFIVDMLENGKLKTGKGSILKIITKDEDIKRWHKIALNMLKTEGLLQKL